MADNNPLSSQEEVHLTGTEHPENQQQKKISPEAPMTTGENLEDDKEDSDDDEDTSNKKDLKPKKITCTPSNPSPTLATPAANVDDDESDFEEDDDEESSEEDDDERSDEDDEESSDEDEEESSDDDDEEEEEEEVEDSSSKEVEAGPKQRLKLNLLENKSAPSAKADEIQEVDTTDEDESSEEQESKEKPNLNLKMNEPTPVQDSPKHQVPMQISNTASNLEDDKEDSDEEDTDDDEISEEVNSKQKPNLNTHQNKCIPSNQSPALTSATVDGDDEEEDETDEDERSKQEVTKPKEKLNLSKDDNDEDEGDNSSGSKDDDSEDNGNEDDSEKDYAEQKLKLNQMQNQPELLAKPTTVAVEEDHDKKGDGDFGYEEDSDYEEVSETDDDNRPQEEDSNKKTTLDLRPNKAIANPHQGDDDTDEKGDDSSSSEDDDSEDNRNEDVNEEENTKQNPKLNQMQNKSAPPNLAPELAVHGHGKKSGECFGFEEENKDEEVEETDDDDDRSQEEDSKKQDPGTSKIIGNPNQGGEVEEADMAKQVKNNKTPSLPSSHPTKNAPSLIPTFVASKALDGEEEDDSLRSKQGNEDEEVDETDDNESKEDVIKKKQKEATHILNPIQVSTTYKDGDEEKEEENNDEVGETKNMEVEGVEGNKQINPTYHNKTTPFCASRTSVPSKTQNGEEQYDDSVSEEEYSESGSEEKGEEVDQTRHIKEQKKSSSSNKVLSREKASGFKTPTGIVSLKRKSDSKETTDSAWLPNKKKSKLAIGKGNQLKLKRNKVWSLEDEVSILEGMISFKKEEGTYPNGKTMAEFLHFISDSITPGHNKKQLNNKVNKLKQAYKSNAQKEEDNNVLSTPHDLKCFELSKTIWGANSAIVASPISYYNLKRNLEGKIVRGESQKEGSKELVDWANVSLEGANLDQKVSWDKFPRFQAFMELELSGLSEVEKRVEMESMIRIGDAEAREIEHKLKSNLVKKIKLEMQQIEVDKERKDIHSQIKMLRLNFM